MIIPSGRFRTTDRGEFRHDLAMLTPSPPTIEVLDRNFESKVHWISLPRVGCFSLDSTRARISDKNAFDGLGINIPLRGRFDFLSSPLAIAEFENLLAASLLSVAEIGQQRDSERPTLSSPPWLARAEEFMAAHIAEPLSLTELASVVRVSLRTLSRGFHDRYGLGPIAFLKLRRLEAARSALAAVNAEMVSVTDVALRYGFTHLGRFAGDYRDCFGELPSTTLND